MGRRQHMEMAHVGRLKRLYRPCQLARKHTILMALYFLLTQCHQNAECMTQADCYNKEHMYFDEEAKDCEKCLTCDKGFELNKPCGFGRGGDAVCIECEAGYFSDSNGYASCKPCTTCQHAKVHRECTAESDRVCGQCVHGYNEYPVGTCKECTDVECFEYITIQQSNSTTIKPPRRVHLKPNDKDPSNNDNQSYDYTSDHLVMASVILPIVATFLILILLGIIAYFNVKKQRQLKRQQRSRRSRESQNEQGEREESRETGQPTTAAENEAFVGTDTERDTENSSHTEGTEEVDIEAGEDDTFLEASNTTQEDTCRDVIGGDSLVYDNKNETDTLINTTTHEQQRDQTQDHTSITIIHDTDTTDEEETTKNEPDGHDLAEHNGIEA